MFICLACEPNHELGDGYTPAFCSEHSPEPASSEPRRPHLAVEFVASTCTGAIPARPASRTGRSTCPSKQTAEFAREKTAE